MSESTVRSPSVSSRSPEGEEEGGIRPADYDTETVERVYKYVLTWRSRDDLANSPFLLGKLISELFHVSTKLHSSDAFPLAAWWPGKSSS